MLHIVGNTGQLGNQLFRFAHHVANAIEYNYSVRHHAFDYVEHYPNLTNNYTIVLNPWSKSTNQLLRKATPYIEKQFILKWVLSLANVSLVSVPFEFTLADKKFLQSVTNSHTIATDLLFRDYSSFRKHADVLRRMFEPVKAANEKTSQCVDKLKTEYDTIIGVHIRRGDYRYWQNGRYYYSNQIYGKFMQRIIDLHSNENIVFILCSNEKITMESFKNFNVFISESTTIEDLTLLSKCEKIIGPPSTFSGWASFMGNAPLYYISDPSKIIELEDFKVIMG